MVGEALRIGLIGCGRAAERLWLPALRRVSEARLVAAADVRAERRALVAREVPGCRQVEQAEALMAGGGVDAVIVATPPESHFHLARLGLEAGVPLLVEKPLAATVAQTVELDQLRRATATPLMVGFNRRWWLPALRLREMLQGEAGPGWAELVFVTEAAQWKAIAGCPDLLDDLATHQFDLLRFLFKQEIASVSATQTRPREIRMEAELVNGTYAVCRVAHDGGSEESVRVTTGSLRAWIHARSDRIAPAGGASRTALDLTGRVWRRLTGRQSTMRRSFEDELRAFIRAVRDGAEPSPGAADAIAAASALAAARESLAHAGAPVSP